MIRAFIYGAVAAVLTACGGAAKPGDFRRDSLLVRKYINTGDSIYATKASQATFLKSMEYFDSALHVAEASKSTRLIGMAIFAKGRAFDAINNNPQKTIDYYKEAARLYGSLPDKYLDALYIKHLVAHSYDKVKDSINCIAILQQLISEISPKPDSIKYKLRFTAEMALISTEVKNYALAEEILSKLTRREWIKNNANEYDYLDHYYLTRARIAVFNDRDSRSPYLDSLESVFNKCKSLSDSMYYSEQLWDLYSVAGNMKKEGYFLHLFNDISNKFNTPQSVRESDEIISRMETAALEKERKTEQEKAQLHKKYVYLLGGLLLIISVLTLFLVKRNKEIRRKRNEALISSRELLQKNLQNELLNKELHHRVKNNLQMILSLVYMQERNTTADETKTNLQDIRLRIESIAALHNQLMDQQEEKVDIKKYITRLVNSMAGLVGDNHHIFTYLDIDNISLSVKQSFPLGLMLNEWITNSMKYARTNNDALSLFITVTKEGDKINITYKDSGSPVRKSECTSKLGMNIISLLAAQMNGELIRDDADYFKYQLIIPANGGEY